MRAVDDVGFATSFLGRFADELDEQRRFRAAVGELLVRVIEIKTYVDTTFANEASSTKNKEKGWRNMEYCRRWEHVRAPSEYKAWRAEQENGGAMEEDDPLLSFQFFCGPAACSTGDLRLGGGQTPGRLPRQGPSCR